ncbi:hypothetical protein BDV38DRAFT_236102 [Aspergillus pseudotamarii]|uniref:Uncharacterized protein n=1 Tax=Aspergillus pseudotamarii TaxID=132259 RepID=A0A5N6T755_ASPPS|nr:uncharacterized protein BDV38DRAFT_236102 [Aspergillus pseudotamarii]KAE8142194.1 hypothetical protein BDV38DRAFT_236102 [Aspergillus pseudotamarii]
MMSHGDSEPLAFVKHSSGLLYGLGTVLVASLFIFLCMDFVIGSPSPPKLCFLFRGNYY